MVCFYIVSGALAEKLTSGGLESSGDLSWVERFAPRCKLMGLLEDPFIYLFLFLNFFFFTL